MKSSTPPDEVRYRDMTTSEIYADLQNKMVDSIGVSTSLPLEKSTNGKNPAFLTERYDSLEDAVVAVESETSADLDYLRECEGGFFAAVRFHQDSGGLSTKRYYYRTSDSGLTIGGYGVVCVAGRYCIVRVEEVVVGRDKVPFKGPVKTLFAAELRY